MSEEVLDPRFTAAVDLIRRTGARSVQVRWSDDEVPTVWFVVVEHLIGDDDRPVATGGTRRFDTAAGMSPLAAALRLCDLLIDAGTCVHCGRPSGFDRDFGAMPLNGLICWYQWDPELKTFRRGCGGD